MVKILRMSHAAHRGFSLVELMVALAVAGVIGAVAYPAFTAQLMKGRRSDAIDALSRVVQAQERYRANQASYAGSLVSGLGFSTSNSVNGHYALTVAGVGTPASLVPGFTVTATPVSGSPQARDSDCASFSLTVQLGQLTHSAINSAGGDSTALCWPK
jgi:type IV pilus assembly protein PilE